MTDKQQIKEIATLIVKHAHRSTKSIAEILYNAGYRKQREWISVDERLPDESGRYLAYTDLGNRNVLDYSARHKLFNAYDCYSRERAKGFSLTITHWMPLPEDPKGGVQG